MQETPQTVKWTCELLVWHGLYQHPEAKDKNEWYVYPEHAIAGAEEESINEWAFLGKPSYTADIIRRIMETTQELAEGGKVVDVRCSYECSNYHRAEDGETCIMWLVAEQGPVIEGYGGVSVEYVGVFDAKTCEYKWHPRTPIDDALVKRYFHHVPSQEELNFMCRCGEGCLFGLDSLLS